MSPAAARPSRRQVVSLLAGAVFGTGCRKAPALPVLGQVGDFALTDQAGKFAGASTLRGQVWAAAFMFTRCPTVCPRITRRMRELQQSAGTGRVKLRLVSFSVDPEHDTAAVLAAYAKQYQADLASWSFLTGDLEVVRKTAVEGFKLAFDGKAQAEKEHFGLLHGSHLVLADPQLQIRGYYSTADAAELRRLLTDAGTLG